jgi:hypothetical protein
MTKSNTSPSIEINQEKVDKVVGILLLLDESLCIKKETEYFPYIKQRKIINSLFAKNSILNYAEQVMLRLIVIDSLYSTNAAYSYFSMEEMAEKILSLGDDQAASDYFYGIATRKHTGKILFEERYGIRKNLEQGSKQMSLLSKYAYYLLLQNKERYPLGFPIYDSLAIEQYPKLYDILFDNKGKAVKYIKNNIDDYIAALDELRKEIFDNNSYKFILQQFDLLDAYLWRMGKMDGGNFSLLLSRSEYIQLIENLGLRYYIVDKEVKNGNEEKKKEKDALFAKQITKKCKDLKIEDVTQGIENTLFIQLLTHWKTLTK